MLPLARGRALARHLAQRLGTDVGHNTFCLYLEVMFAGVLAAAGSFNGAYILRLGGSKELVGLLASIPALVATVLYLPSARVLEKQRRQGQWIVWSLAMARSGYLAIVILPLLISYLIPEITVGILVLMTVPSVFFSTGWSPMLSDVIPEGQRATVLAWRSILSSATIAPLVYVLGRWLDRGTFPSNYQWMYGIAVLAGMLSVLIIARIRIPERATAETVAETPSERANWRRALRDLTRTNRPFVRVIANTLLFNLGAWMVGPLYIVFFVRELQASDAWVGLHTTLAHIGVVAGYWAWRRIIQRTGEAKAMLLALPILSAYAFMVALVPTLNFILFAGFFVNLVAPGFNLSHGVVFLQLLPQKRRHTWMATYSAIMNLGAFVCPLIGVAISGAIGIVPTLLIGGGLRMLGAGLFYAFPVVEGTRPGRPGWLVRPRLFGSR